MPEPLGGALDMAVSAGNAGGLRAVRSGRSAWAGAESVRRRPVVVDDNDSKPSCRSR